MAQASYSKPDFRRHLPLSGNKNSDSYYDYIGARAVLKVGAHNTANEGVKIGPVSLGAGHVLQLRGSFGGTTTADRWLLTLLGTSDAGGV